MKKRIRIILLTIIWGILLIAMVQAESQEKIILEDSFDDNNNNWAEGDTADYTLTISDGVYVFEHKKATGCWLSWYGVNIDPQQDFQISAVISKRAGVDNYGYGIIWGFKDGGNYYEFSVSGDGHYQYSRTKDDQWEKIIGWTPSPYVQQKNSTNTLSLRKSGNRLEFFVNDHAVNEAPVEEFFGNKIGFVVNNNIKIEIDHLLVKSLPPGEPPFAIAEKRLALVIGNSEYHDAPLDNPVNDARAMATVLQRLGFEVIQYENLDQKAMKRAIDDFGDQLQAYDVGLFFYSGHGTQVQGENYLIPIDAAPKNENEVEYDCIQAGRVLAKMEAARSAVNIIMLDACRSNPFERSWTRSSQGKGLAFMNAPSGSLIAYATSPGNVAYDTSSQKNSPYTAALLQHIETPNITILEMFQRVRVAVEQETQNQQTPWESTSLRGNFYFKK